MSEEHRRRVAEGIAAFVTTAAEMGQTEADARQQAIDLMRSLGEEDPTLLLDAADAVTRQPMPPGHPVDRQEQREQIEKMLGLTSVSDQLAAALRAREWLRTWAQELGANG